TVIDNPQKSGINTSNKVGRMVKSAGEVYGGSVLTLLSPIDFTSSKIFRMKVFSPRVGAKVLLKVENISNGAINFEVETAVTVANQWEDLSFNYNAIPANSYQKIVLIFDLGTMGDGSANFTFLFDDIRLETSGGSGLAQMDLPVTFDDPTVEYGLIGFGGAENSTIVADPTDATNKVAKVIKSAGAELWAGTTITAAAQLGFKNKIPITMGNTFMNVNVWSPDAGIKVRLKIEDHTDPTKSVETEATTTVAGGWQNLVFNFANQAQGTAAVNYGYNYTKASIFFNFGVTGAQAGEKTYYFDNVAFGSQPLPVRLLSFVAEKSGATVLLTWSTATEQQNKEFGIERSDADGKWMEIARVNGAGNSNSVRQYSAVDRMPLSGVGFYRLRQTDHDGVTTYSSIRKVDFSGTLTDGFKVFPNPASGRVIVLSNVFSGNVQYTLTATSGATLRSGIINNPVSETGLDISNLPEGMYILKLTDGKQTKIQKLMVR
ncbi:MAG TPA: T9SS type A sorting domain-containing protein, partial [Phnomibacter sp.]|nr:T9SS type A sorting domain-containing protein [Phnomibacter sp.]